jgi:hypothetical protein
MGGMCKERNIKEDKDMENNCKYFMLFFNNYLSGKFFSMYNSIMFKGTDLIIKF